MIKSCTLIIRAITIFVMAFFFSSVTLSDDQTDNLSKANNPLKDEHQLFFTLENEKGLPDNQAISEFDCSDKVYAVMKLKNLQPGKHHLAVLWYGPDEEIREHTEFSIFAQGPLVKQWAWLKLHRAFGASMLQLLNPAAGMEEFIGDWRVDVKIDNKLIINKTFKVIC